MNKVDKQITLHQTRGYRVLWVAVLSLLMILLLAQALAAQEPAAEPPDLSGSYKEVDLDRVEPSSQLHYTIVLSNNGGSLASGVVLTDELPTALAYETGTLAVDGGGTWGEHNGVITWTGGVNVGAPVVVSFDAVVSDSLTAGEFVTNTATITGTGEYLLRQVVTEIISETVGGTVYLPLIAKSPRPPTLNPVSHPSSSNTWTVSWSWDGIGVPDYVLQESQSADFGSAITYDMGSATSKLISHVPSFNNRYYYRVQVVVNGIASGWSGVRSVAGGYEDSFNSSSSGWAIRRQDTDDINNGSWYENGGFVLSIGGRWDYAIASPLAVAPSPPYRISTRVKWLENPDNLHSYGLIFGGDWNGQACPNADYSSCFNHYYRLNVVWHGPDTSMLVQLKRIDYHDPDSNAGGGVTLIDYFDAAVKPQNEGNVWMIEVQANGTIKLYVNGNLLRTVTDSTYVNNPYFGVFASSNEYLGSRPWFDWYKVEGVD